MNINGIVILGAPGSGKSSIGKLLAEQLNAIYVSSGNIARNMALTDKFTQESLQAGGLANEEKMRNEIYRTLYAINLKGREFVLDGFPRNIEQYHWLIDKFPSIAYYFIDVDTKTCMKRLRTRGRSDDVKMVIMGRIGYYERETLVLIEYLKREMILRKTIHNNYERCHNCAVTDIINDAKEVG